MEIGSIVETVADFESERRYWGLPYPKKGRVLTVSSISKHPVEDVSRLGIVLLTFEEIPNLKQICDKKVNGEPNFIELILPDDILEIFEQPVEVDYITK